MADKTEERQGIISDCVRHPTRYYWINLTGVTLGSLFLLSSYSVLFYIQSSLHTKEGLGTTTLAVDYAAQMVTCFFLPTLLIRTIGCKWCLVVSGVCISVFNAANLHSSFSTMIPGAVFLGTGYATMWVTRNAVVSDLAKGYSSNTGISEPVILARFFSIFYAVVNTASIWGNVIGSQILSSKAKTEDVTNNSNVHLTCGAQFCSMDQQPVNNLTSNATLDEVPQSEVNTLVIAAISIAGIGIILILCLLSTYKIKVLDSKETPLYRLLTAVRLHRHPNLLLLIVTTVNPGIMISFFTADVTEAFVTCSIGIHNVGLVVTSFGVATALGTALLYLASSIPRPILFIGALILNVADLFLMLFWVPNPDASVVFYVIAGIWGASMAVWMSQLLALYGDVFGDQHQAAYSAARFWDGLGFVIGFTWSQYLCIHTKIYILMATLVCGTVGYLVVEVRIMKSRKQLAYVSK